PQPHYIGSVCLRPYKPQSDGAQAGKELEFLYLFVLEPFRTLKVARYLLRRAHQEARKQGWSALVFEALPQYLEGLLYLRRVGFELAPDRKGKKGRVVLVFPTSDVFPDPE